MPIVGAAVGTARASDDGRGRIPKRLADSEKGHTHWLVAS